MPRLGVGGGVGLAALMAFGGADPLAAFAYEVDFANATSRGVAQPYGNNTNDGRAFRDPANFQATFVPNKAGLLIAQAASGLRRTDRGLVCYQDQVIRGLWGSDFTQTAWTKTNVTALKNQVGADGAANAASSLTATANGGTVSQAITSTVLDRGRSAWVKRLVGSGTLEMSLDGGTTWTAVTVTSNYSLVYISQAAVTDPVIMWRIGTSGDSFAIDMDMTYGYIRSAAVPLGLFVRTVGTSFGTLNHSQPWANKSDAGPLSSMLDAGFAFFWQGSGAIDSTGSMFLSDGVTQVVVSAGNSITFNQNSNPLVSPAGQWIPGLANRNKVAGFIAADGTMRLCVNGNAPVGRTGGSFSPSATHYVVSANGSGNSSLCGYVEKFAITAGLTFTDAELIAMTSA